jgi:hypothetical protein
MKVSSWSWIKRASYRVFNKASPKVGITIDVRFDETNGSQVEQVGLRIVDNDKPSCEAVK